MTFPLTQRIYIYFTRQTCLTLPNVLNTSTFIKHKQTNKKKNFLNSFNVQKGLGKIIHIKEDQADVFKITENIFFFSLFFLYNRSFSKSIDIR